MQLLHRMFGSPRQSFLAFLFPICLMLAVMATMHSCGRSGDFHKRVDEVKEEEAADGEGGEAEAAGMLKKLELFPR